MLSVNSRLLLACLAAAMFIGLAATQYEPLWGQEPADSPEQASSAEDQPAEQAERRRARGRLPAYYARVVSGDQREQIYKIQQGYEPKIQELLAQVAELRQKRDKEIDATLTPEQLERVNELRAAARERQAAQRQRQNREQPRENDSPQ